MQALAAGVGDLKKVLSNVRARGAFGEVQLDALLDQFLSPEQYIKNAQTKDGSLERVEFAIKFPGRDGNGEVLLPVDAKFPLDDYERLIAASEAGNLEDAAIAAKALEARVRTSAKSIRDKYINPPRTVDFGVLFLPIEKSIRGGAETTRILKVNPEGFPRNTYRANDVHCVPDRVADGISDDRN